MKLRFSAAITATFVVATLAVSCGSDVPKDPNNANNSNNANNANNTNNANNVNNVNNVNNANNTNNTNNANSVNNQCEGNVYTSPCAGVWNACDGSAVYAFECVSGDEGLSCTCTIDGTVEATVAPDSAVNCSGELLHQTANAICEWELGSLSGL